MHTFLERLRAKGISCPDDYSFNELLKDSTSVQMALFETATQDVVNQIMKESDNLNAQAYSVAWVHKPPERRGFRMKTDSLLSVNK